MPIDPTARADLLDEIARAADATATEARELARDDRHEAATARRLAALAVHHDDVLGMVRADVRASRWRRTWACWRLGWASLWA